MPEEAREVENWLKEGLGELGIEANGETQGQLAWLGLELLEWNRRLNLTAIRDTREMVHKHLVDSATGLLAGPLDGRLCDLGTGPGLPGLVLKVLQPATSVLLVDSVGKKLQFARHVIETLELQGIETLHARAEELGRDGEYREKFRAVTARALAPLPVLLEYAIPLLEVGGRLVAYKGPMIEAEIASAGRALALLGTRVENVLPIRLPEEFGERSLAVFRKEGSTDPQYPRRPGLPTRRPL